MKRLIIAAATLSLIGATAASAQPRPNGDRDRDGVPNAYDRDRDGDGVRNNRDRNPNQPNGYAQQGGDRDRDGVPNRFDRDRDGDGIRNDRDRNPNQPNGYGRPGDRDGDGIRNNRDPNPNRYNRYTYGGRQYDRFRGPRYNFPRGYAYRSWNRGQVLPRGYFASPYYVDNWSAYRLRPPPRGYRYVRVGNDVVLAAIAGGLIAEVIGGVFY